MGGVGSGPATGYNGWSNYETWAVALWIGNEQGSYQYWEQDQAGECYRDAVKEQLGEWVFGPGNDADLLNAALQEVNRHEIAEHYVAEVDRAGIEEEEADAVRAEFGDGDAAA